MNKFFNFIKEKSNLIIKILSIVAITFYLLGCLTFAGVYTWKEGEKAVFKIDFSYVSTMQILIMLSELATYALLVVFAFCKKIRKPLLISIFSLSALTCLLAIISSLTSTAFDWLDYLNISLLVVYSGAIYFSMKGFSKPIFPLAVMGASLTLEGFIRLFWIVNDIRFHFTLFAFTDFADLLAISSLVIAITVFIVKDILIAREDIEKIEQTPEYPDKY